MISFFCFFKIVNFLIKKEIILMKDFLFCKKLFESKEKEKKKFNPEQKMEIKHFVLCF